MSREKGFPYVLVSQYSREQAHLLDWQSQNWLKSARVDLYHALPVGEEYNINYGEAVDHMDFLHNLARINERFEKVSEDCRSLGNYLQVLNKERTIGGRRVPRDEFRDHKDAILRHSRYKQSLSTSLRLQIKLYQSLIGSKLERAVKSITLVNANVEARLINNLVHAVARTKNIEWTDELKKAMTTANEYITGKVAIDVIGRDVDDLFEQLATAHADEVKSVDPGFPRSSEDLEQHEIMNATSDQIIKSIRHLSSSDYNAVVYIARQLLFKKALSVSGSSISE